MNVERIRVLLADDEEEWLSTVVERLGFRGMDAVGVTRGVDVLREVDSRGFDAVVLDVKMPGLGGLDVIRRMKETHGEMEVILLSGHGSKESMEEGLRLGAFEYLQKPIDIEALVEAIKRAAARGRERSSG